MKKLPKILNTLRCDTAMMSRIDVRQVSDQPRAVLFYLSHGLVGVCEIEISHMGKNNENPDLVCQNKMLYSHYQLFANWWDQDPDQA